MAPSSKEPSTASSSAGKTESEPYEDPALKQANHWPTDCNKCKVPLAEEVEHDPAMEQLTKEQLMEKHNALHLMLTNHEIMIRHLEHELTDIQTAKNEVVVHAEKLIMQQNETIANLQQTATQHPAAQQSETKASKLADADNEMSGTITNNKSTTTTTTTTNPKQEFTPEELSVINNITITLRIKKDLNWRTLPPHHNTVFQEIKTINITPQDLTCWYKLTMAILQAANDRSDGNILIAVEMLPRLDGERVVYRALQSKFYGAWVDGLKMWSGGGTGEYGMVAFLYDDGNDEAIEELEKDEDIILY